MSNEIKVACIGGLFTIIAAIIGIFSYNIGSSNNDTIKYYELKDEYDKL